MRTLLSRLFVFAALATFLLVGCGSLRSAGDAAKSALVDCTKHETAKVVGELRPLMGTVIAHAVNDAGKLDYGPVRDLAKGFVSDVSRCAVADAVARLLDPPDDPAAPKNEPLRVDVDAARAGFAELFGGQRFKTERGEI